MLGGDLFSVKSLITTILFILLVPGVLLTVPDAKGAVKFGQTPQAKEMMTAILVHAVVFHFLNKFLSEEKPHTA
jgi:hypothetical protein